MRITRHAAVQQQRRGISSELLNLVLCHGDEHKAKEHASMYRLSRKEVAFLKSECPAPLWRRYRDSITRTVPLVSADGTVITAMHRIKRLKTRP